MTTAAQHDETSAARVTCHRCLSHYRVHALERLSPASRSSCPTCGARFAVVETVPADPGQDWPNQQDRLSSVPDPSSTPDATASMPPSIRASFHGMGGTLLGMHVVNVCLTLATLGGYHFWAKAKIRRYLFSQTSFAGDRFVYHGTGKELYQGFLKAMLIFGIPYFFLTAAHTFLDLPSWIDGLSQALAGLVLFLYVPVAIVNARRYRCTRTSWRGIRFSFRGRTADFLKLYFRGWLFTVLTLGTYYPYFQTQRQAFLHSHTYFGNQRFRFTGHGSGVMIPFVVTLFATYAVLGLCGLALALQLANAGLTLLLMPFVLGPLWIWLLGQKQRYFWNHTSFGEARFSSDITWQRLFTLYLGNLGLLVTTLGWAWPWVTVRNARFFIGTLSLQGPVDLDRVLQDTTDASVTGEGLSNLLDTGFDMDS
ncbi:MAG: DUF898 domain-containing protein [Nitrospira sp.]|nr:DUF898 domain-containing protein [Nitrospira sp.]